MVSFRDLGTSMTGASYAALPMGPQLNNYRDLVCEIKASDVSSVTILSDQEKEIIKNISKKFPTQKQVYDASHREPIWLETIKGNIIYYTDAHKLIEM